MTVPPVAGEKPSLEQLEGMILAHRQIIGLLIARIEAQVPDILAAMEERLVVRDGQEDPGAVPTEGLSLQLALTEEMKRLRNVVEVMRGA